MQYSQMEDQDFNQHSVILSLIILVLITPSHLRTTLKVTASMKHHTKQSTDLWQRTFNNIHAEDFTKRWQQQLPSTMQHHIQQQDNLHSINYLVSSLVFLICSNYQIVRKKTEQDNIKWSEDTKHSFKINYFEATIVQLLLASFE